MSETIDWEDMCDGAFVKLETGEPKDMLVTCWRKQTAFKDDDGNIRKGIVFDVHMEDGRELMPPKTWTTTSARCLAKLRPLLEGKKPEEKLGITVTRTGQGKGTMYEVVAN